MDSLPYVSDIAVGAPYEGSGAMYIFRGSAQGLIPDFSQRITASDLNLTSFSGTFGHSVSGGLDVDGNSYPDVVVGAYASDTIMILRARPVINVHTTMSSNPQTIDKDITECNKDIDQKPYNCFEIKVCFKFTAKPVERYVWIYTWSFWICLAMYIMFFFIKYNLKHNSYVNNLKGYHKAL